MERERERERGRGREGEREVGLHREDEPLDGALGARRDMHQLRSARWRRSVRHGWFANRAGNKASLAKKVLDQKIDVTFQASPPRCLLFLVRVAYI